MSTLVSDGCRRRPAGQFSSTHRTHPQPALPPAPLRRGEASALLVEPNQHNALDQACSNRENTITSGKVRFAACVLTFSSVAALAAAQSPSAQSNAPNAAHKEHADAFSQEFNAAMQRIHETMIKANDGDPDRAVALKMRQHHKGGIEMGRMYLATDTVMTPISAQSRLR